jgi:protein-disulfide isomerase
MSGKKSFSVTSIFVLISVTTSIFIYSHRLSMQKEADTGSEPKIVSNTIDGYGITKSADWQVIVFKNYECTACRSRKDEFKKSNEYQIKFATYIIRSMKLSLPAARLAYLAKQMGQFDKVDTILSVEPELTESAIKQASELLKGATESERQSANDEVTKDTILAARLRVKSIPICFAISPKGVIYEASNFESLVSLIASKN